MGWRLLKSTKQLDFIFKNSEINKCHGFEHSLTMLSCTIFYLLPLLRSYHIQYLFIQNQELQDVAAIINGFLRQYCNLPHIKSARNDVKDTTEWSKTQYDMGYNDVYEKLIYTKHPILQRIMDIISSLYQHIDYLYKSLRRDKDVNLMFIKRVKLLRHSFHKFMYKWRPRKSYRIMLADIPYVDHIWNLIPLIVDCDKSDEMDNKSRRKLQNEQISCAGCCKKQWLFRKKFKMCKGCKLAYYCSKKCQKYDWVRNKHSNVCKLLAITM